MPGDSFVDGKLCFLMDYKTPLGNHGVQWLALDWAKAKTGRVGWLGTLLIPRKQLWMRKGKALLTLQTVH